MPTASCQLTYTSPSACFLLRALGTDSNSEEALETEASICGPYAHAVAHLVPTPWGKACAIPAQHHRPVHRQCPEMVLWLSNSPAWEESSRLCQGHLYGSPHPAPTLL